MLGFALNHADNKAVRVPNTCN